jgi:hypothetical protein
VHHTTEHAHEMHVRLPTMPGFEWLSCRPLLVGDLFKTNTAADTTSPENLLGTLLAFRIMRAMLTII